MLFCEHGCHFERNGQAPTARRGDRTADVYATIGRAGNVLLKKHQPTSPMTDRRHRNNTATNGTVRSTAAFKVESAHGYARLNCGTALLRCEAQTHVKGHDKAVRVGRLCRRLD